MNELTEKLNKSNKAVLILSQLDVASRNRALSLLVDVLQQDKQLILEANQKDLLEAEKSGATESFKDRLKLTEERLESIADSVKIVINSKDPLGVVLESFAGAKDIQIQKVSVPLGVVGIIYEGRPNVTVDAAALLIKSGNVGLLRGSRTALNTNFQLIETIKKALTVAELPVSTIEGLFDNRSAVVDEMLSAVDLIDVVIPRGGKEFIDYVRKNSKVPVIETGSGNCHVFIANDAEYKMARDIVINAKVSRPSVCNAIENVLIESGWAKTNLTNLVVELKKHGVEIRGCAATKNAVNDITLATEEDYQTEFLDLVITVKVVESLEEAIQHISTYGSKHSECIVTDDLQKAEQFLNSVDAACVYHNCSTRFSDGGEFGFGAEIGISTQKLHARGPLGLKELTSYKYKVRGVGQIR